MQAQTVQLRVTLPIELQGFLLIKARKLGLNMSSYVKNLIINDVRNEAYPTFAVSERVEKAYKQAKQDESKGKLVETDDLESFLDSL